MTDEPMTLLDRLRNPQWVHGCSHFESPQLDRDQTRRDMQEAVAEIERLRAALSAERERCARHLELIAADWREAGSDQKVWASEYLASQIRDLDPIDNG